MVTILETDKEMLLTLKVVSKKKSLEEAAKVTKVLGRFKNHSVTKTNEIFYFVTNRLGTK